MKPSWAVVVKSKGHIHIRDSAYNLLLDAGHRGMTAHEVRDAMKAAYPSQEERFTDNAVGGALTNLQDKGDAFMIEVERRGCLVYVLDYYVNGRTKHVRRQAAGTKSKNGLRAVIEDVIDLLEHPELDQDDVDKASAKLKAALQKFK